MVHVVANQYAGQCVVVTAQWYLVQNTNRFLPWLCLQGCERLGITAVQYVESVDAQLLVDTAGVRSVDTVTRGDRGSVDAVITLECIGTYAAGNVMILGGRPVLCLERVTAVEPRHDR